MERRGAFALVALHDFLGTLAGLKVAEGEENDLGDHGVVGH